DCSVVEHDIEITAIKGRDLRVARSGVGRRSTIGDIHLGDHDLETAVRYVLEESGETLLVKPVAIFGCKMTLDPDSIDRRVPLAKAIKNSQQRPAPAKMIRRVIFDAVLIQCQQRLRVSFARRMEGDIEILRPDLFEKDVLAQAVRSALGQDRLVDDVP